MIRRLRLKQIRDEILMWLFVVLIAALAVMTTAVAVAAVKFALGVC